MQFSQFFLANAGIAEKTLKSRSNRLVLTAFCIKTGKNGFCKMPEGQKVTIFVYQ